MIWCFILCERQFFYKNSLALSTNQNNNYLAGYPNPAFQNSRISIIQLSA